MLLEPLSALERCLTTTRCASTLVGAYFKVIEDHLYMPLQRVYAPVARHDYDYHALSAVQQLLHTIEIAKDIFQKTVTIYAISCFYISLLSDSAVNTFSIRDVKMFQVYLSVCSLQVISAIQQESFRLSVMLYLTLKVQYKLIRQMLHLLGQEIRDRLTPKQAHTLMPYFQVL
jgi:hypothetical protein